MFHVCDLVHKFKVFEFLRLQVQVDHDLSLLEELLAESQDPQALFQSLSVLVLRVPLGEKSLFDEFRL